eukprot:9490924-Pyramimonas_sp.AAC.1
MASVGCALSGQPPGKFRFGGRSGRRGDGGRVRAAVRVKPVLEALVVVAPGNVPTAPVPAGQSLERGASFLG